MESRVDGKVALVTGASRGIGEAIAQAFLASGARGVVITSRKQENLDEAAERLDGGDRLAAVAARSDTEEGASTAVQTAIDSFGSCDILVNNAGTNVPQSIDEVKDEDWDNVLELNFSSCMALSRALVPQMKERKWGRIIHISSIMALGSKEQRHIYSGTKAALIGMARAMALELGPYNITTNCLAPGPFLTDLPGRVLSDEQKKSFATRTALGRWGDPAELAGPALLLASDAGSYITGETLVVDGGTLCKTF